MYELSEFIRMDNSDMCGAGYRNDGNLVLGGYEAPANPFRIRKEYWTKAGEILFPPADAGGEDVTCG